jgi:hypothetical protein
MEAIAKSRRRFRFTLGGVLIAILVIALILGGIEHVRREKRRDRHSHDQLTLLVNVTQTVLTSARQTLIPADAQMSSSRMGMGSSYVQWHTSVGETDATGRKLIELEIRGSITESDLQPITIIHGNAKLDREIIQLLSKEYGKRQWKYTIQPPFK